MSVSISLCIPLPHNNAAFVRHHIMDDGDDADALRAADAKAKLNQQVQELVDARLCLRPGVFTDVRPMLTGDGKAMLASNAMEGRPKE